MKAFWNNQLIAESEDTIVVEGNHYFPVESISKEYFEDSQTHTECSWKGTASYFNIKVNNELNSDAAWFYPNPKDAAEQVKGRVAFWKGVEIKE